MPLQRPAQDEPVFFTPVQIDTKIEGITPPCKFWVRRKLITPSLV
jgi:hypothetical protein